MWVATAATPYIMVNNSSGCVPLDNLREQHTVGCLDVHEELAGFQPSVTTGEAQVGPDVGSRRNRRRRGGDMTGSTSTEHTSNAGGNGPLGVGQTPPLWLETPPGQSTVTLSRCSRWALAPTEGMPIQVSPEIHDRSGGTNGGNSESRWRRYEHSAPPLPDEFMARYVNVLMYLAEILQADHVSAFLFGRCPPRYYQRMRANRFDRRRRRRRRRFAMYAYDIGMLFRGAWRTNRASSCCIEDLPGTAVAPATAPLVSAPAVPATSVISASSSSLVSSIDPVSAPLAPPAAEPAASSVSALSPRVSSNDHIAAPLALAAAASVASVVSASSSLVSSNVQPDPSAANSVFSQVSLSCDTVSSYVRIHDFEGFGQVHVAEVYILSRAHRLLSSQTVQLSRLGHA